MSLDMGGGISSAEGVPGDRSMVAEEYCQNAMARFRSQWMQTGTFHPAALRGYGVHGGATLMRSLMQTRSFGATFGTFLLGDLPVFGRPADVTVVRPSPSPPPGIATVRSASGSSISAAPKLLAEGDVPMSAVLLGPRGDASVRAQCTPEELATMQDELTKSFVSLTQPSEWNQAMCGVTTVPNFTTAEQRRRIQQQLDLAAFVGVRYVQVPLPMLMNGCWESDEASESGSQSASAPPASAEEYAERNWQLLAAAADILSSFVRSSGEGSTRLWVRCDACYPLQRRQFHALRALMIHGSERDPVTHKVVGPRAVTAENCCEDVRRESLHVLCPLLFFSDPYALSSFSTEWLGEDICVFEVPPANILLHCLQAPEGADEHVTDDDRDRSAEQDLDLYDVPGVHSTPASSHHSSECRADGCQHGEHTGSAAPQAKSSGRRWRLPPDILPPTESRWAGCYTVSRLSLLAFIVELLRRRAFPLFSHFFFDHYAILNYLYYEAVADPARENFVSYEDLLQLPLQPLGHQLSSGVYEVFERDAVKYRQYREAFAAFTEDWVNSASTQSPAKQSSYSPHAVRSVRFLQRLPAAAAAPAPQPLHDAVAGERCRCPPAVSSHVDVEALGDRMYVVLLGCGRGPLIDEILSAVSAVGVQVRIFAVEKNAAAAAFTQLRWRCDPEWQQLAAAFGHSLEVIVADGRFVYEKRQELQLPADFGLCDVVVSELLGSFGDNELSPECIEGFLDQLRAIQREKEPDGLAPNPSPVCIPASYTAWVAPVHSTKLEQSVLSAAVKGLTVQPDGGADRHRALFHTPLVCNLCRALLLCPPKPCWTFRHESSLGATEGNSRRATAAPRASQTDDGARRVALQFAVPPQGRCSGLAGFFSAVLYTPTTGANRGRPVTIATVPVHSAEASVEGRSGDMYSWFPCFFPVDPSEARDLPLLENFAAAPPPADGQGVSKSGTLNLAVSLSRNVDAAAKRVWYSWSLQYDAPHMNRLVMNEGGWASTVLL